MELSGIEITLSQESGSTLCLYEGFPVRQHYFEKVGRYYVWLPKRSGLRERFRRPDRMLRSHFIVCLRDGLDEIPYGMVVHHKDRDRTNDDPSNLELLTAADHDELHRTDGTFKQPGFKGRRHSSETLAKMRKHAIKRGNNGVWNGSKKCHDASTRALMSAKASGSGNPAFRADLDDEAVREFYRQCGNIARTAAHFGCSNTAVRNRIGGVVPEARVPNAKKARSLTDIACYAALHGVDQAAARYGISEEEVRMKIVKLRGMKNEDRQYY